VRVETEYERAHLPGAVSLPPGGLDSGLRTIPKDRLLIFYCA
jgi:rhodanese-related sulfurtransferase